MRPQLRIPLHGKGTAIDRLSLLADMASLNPKGFRAASEKKNRKRVPTYAEKLAKEVANGG